MSSAKADVALTDFSSIFRLDGKVAVVSGGSRGLGLHAASGLLQAGCSKVFITSRKAAACEEAVAALNALPNKAPGAQAISIPADSSKLSDIERLVKEVGKHTDHVDILFANAGATWGSEFEKVDERNGWDKVMDLNVKGVFFTIQKYFFPFFSTIYVIANNPQIYSPPHRPSLPNQSLPRHCNRLRRRHRRRQHRHRRHLLLLHLQSRRPAPRAQPSNRARTPRRDGQRHCTRLLHEQDGGGYYGGAGWGGGAGEAESQWESGEAGGRGGGGGLFE